MELKEMKEEIERLDDIVNVLKSTFDKDWYSKPHDDFAIESFNEYCDKRNKFCQPHLNQLIKLEREYNFKRPIESLEEIPDYGDVMDLEEFVDCVKDGGFIDYDGFGNYIQDDKMTDIEIRPSHVKNKLVRKEFKKIIWFNR